MRTTSHMREATVIGKNIHRTIRSVQRTQIPTIELEPLRVERHEPLHQVELRRLQNSEI